MAVQPQAQSALPSEGQIEIAQGKQNAAVRTPPKKSKKKRSHNKRKPKKLLRPNSPAAYCPSPLPVLNDYFDCSDESSDDESRIRQENQHGAASVDSVTPSCNGPASDVTGATMTTGDDDKENERCRSAPTPGTESFLAFRLQYLIVHIAIMLADGLQGTHLYVLYEGYGYTVASLYCLGFVSGAVSSPFIGPLVDHKIGRRNAALIYCVLEIIINMMEQYSVLAGLILSRVVGGITTNLLFTVFESWLVTEHRRRGFSEDKLEIIMRDSVVASNLSAIASGCLAHVLASYLGPCGPFEGAVGCTVIALFLVATKWEENFGHHCDDSDVNESPEMTSIGGHMNEAFRTIMSDSKIYRIGIIQGLTEGALQTFVFLWSPALRHFATNIPTNLDASEFVGIDSTGEPAYGLIFGAFMACGALGGMIEPAAHRVFSSIISRRWISHRDQGEILQSKPSMKVDKRASLNGQGNRCSSPAVSDTSDISLDPGVRGAECSGKELESEDLDAAKPAAVVFLASLCYLACAGLLAVPIVVNAACPYSFTLSLVAFLLYEILVGLYMPCEGVLRTIYMPNESICSLMTMLRVIVNVAVALGVISTNYIPFSTAFAACSGALVVAALLQLSLVERQDWQSLSFMFQRSAKISSLESALLIIDDHDIAPVPLVQRLSTVSFSPTISLSSCSTEVSSESEEESLGHDESCDSSNNTAVDGMQQGGLRHRRSRMVS